MNYIKAVIRHMIRALECAERRIDRWSSRARTGKSPKDVLTVGIDPAAGPTGMQIMRRSHDGMITQIKPHVPPLDPEHVRSLVSKTYGLPPGILTGSPLAEAWHKSHPGGWPDGTDQNHWTSWTDPGVGAIGSDMGAEARAMAMAREEIDAQRTAEGYGINGEAGDEVTWPCIHASGMCGHRSVCADRGHCVEDVIQSSESRSNEIVRCWVCAHPDHIPVSGGCTGSVPSSVISGGIELCRCNGERILGFWEGS
jgi:hypothetical protein